MKKITLYTLLLLLFIISASASTSIITNDGIDTIGNFYLNSTGYINIPSNIGIGILIPTVKLHVVGNAIIDGDLNVTGDITADYFYGDLSNATNLNWGSLKEYPSGGNASQAVVSIGDTLTFIPIYNKTSADGRFVNITGDTMNGNLIIETNLTVDTDTLFVNAATNTVGIGTTSPTQLLEVAGNGNFTGNVTATYFKGNGSLLNGILTTETDSLAYNGTLALNSSLSNYYLKSNPYSYYNSTTFPDDYLKNTGDTATGYYSFDTDTLVVDSVNHRVGVGSVNPQELLYLNSSAYSRMEVVTSGSTGAFIKMSNDEGKYGLYTDNDQFVFLDYSDGSTPLLIDGDGNVGIGTTNPELQLDVAKGIKSGGRIQVTGSGELPTSGSGWEIFGSSTSGGMIAYNRDTSSYINGKIVGNTLQLQDGTGNVNLYMSNDQKIGIGTTTPNRDLDVNGDARVRGLFRVGEDGVSDGYLDLDDSGGKTNNPFLTTNSDADLILGSHATGSDIQFKVGNPETTKVTIDTDGNVGIGTTSPTQLLEVAGNGNFTGNPNLYLDRTGVGTADLSIASGSVAGKSGLYIRNTDISSGTPMLHFRASTSGNPEMVIDNGGNVGIGTTTPLGKLEIKSDYGVSSHFAYTNNNTYIRPASTTSGYVIMDYGNVGIGTSNPSEKLEVNGDIQTDWWNSKYFKYKTIRSDPTANKWYHIANITLTSSYDQYSGVFRVNSRTDTSTSTTFGLEFSVGIGQGGTTTAGSSGATIVSLGSYGGYELNAALVLTTDSDPTKIYELYVKAPSISYFRSHITIISSNPFNGATFEIVESDTGVSSLPSGTTTNMIHTIDFNSNGNVGIGTTSPSEKLGVYESSTTGTYSRIQKWSDASGGSLALRVSDLSSPTPTWNFNTGSSQDISFGSSGSEAVRIDSSGNVGIGTSSPSSKLNIKDDYYNLSYTNKNGILIQSNSFAYGNYTPALSFGYGGLSEAGIAGFWDTSDNNQLGLAFFTHPSSSSSADVVEQMRIDSSGNVGIGTSSPSSKLEVDGAITGGSGTASSSTDSLDVSNVNSVGLSTVSGSIVIGGLSGGVTGQVVHLYKTSSANTLTFEHNEATGTQKILTPDATDIVLSTYGGVTMVYNGAYWFVVSK